MNYEKQLTWIAINGEGDLTTEEVDRIITHAAEVSLLPKALIADDLIEVILAYTDDEELWKTFLEAERGTNE